MSAQRIPFVLMLALGLTMMLAPFSIDTYLPAFPRISEALGVSIQSVSLTVSCFVFSMALSQLLGGALSDRYGRRNVLMAGILIFGIASLCIAFSNTLPALLIWRVVQGFGGGWVMVSVPALVRDRVSGQDAAKLFSILGFIGVLAPGIAPSVGSLLLELSTWRSIFVFLAVYAGLLMALSYFVIFRGIPKGERKPFEIGMLRRYIDVIKVRAARPYILWQAGAFSVMMLFITNASFIYQDHFGQSEKAFAMLFGANIVMMFLFNLANRVLLGYFDARRILKWATMSQGTGILFLTLAVVWNLEVSYFLLAMMLTVGSLGAISPNIQACYLEYYPYSGGSATALLGASKFGIAGIASALSTRLPPTLLAVVLAMTGCAAISWAVMFFAKDEERH